MSSKSSRTSTFNSILDWFSLKRNVVIMIATVLILALGDQLWVGYVPKYIEYLGASTLIVGLYGSLKQLVNAIYQYPGGVLSDRMGSKNALVAFSAMPIVEYVIYYVSSSWEPFILGTLFVLMWESMSQLAIFALVGETLPKSRRAMGFSIQSILRRLPITLALGVQAMS